MNETDVHDPLVRVIAGSCTKCGEAANHHPFEFETRFPLTARFSEVRRWTKDVPHSYSCDGQMQLELEPA